MKYFYIITLCMFFGVNAVSQFETIPNCFKAELKVLNSGNNYNAYCTLDKRLPEGYEWGLETEYERIKRILLKNHKGLLSFVGIPVAEGVYSYTEGIIKEKIKDEADKTEARRNQSRYLAYPNNMAYGARFTLSITGFFALMSVIYDYRYEKPQPIRRKKSEEKNIQQAPNKNKV